MASSHPKPKWTPSHILHIYTAHHPSMVMEHGAEGHGTMGNDISIVALRNSTSSTGLGSPMDNQTHGTLRQPSSRPSGVATHPNLSPSWCWFRERASAMVVHALDVGESYVKMVCGSSKAPEIWMSSDSRCRRLLGCRMCQNAWLSIGEACAASVELLPGYGDVISQLLVWCP